MNRDHSALSRPLLGGLLLAALLGLSLAAEAATLTWPSRLNYQGQLTDNSGVAVADGSYSVQFLIYDAPTAGTLLWTETQTVTVTKGLFNAVLGSSTPINLSGASLGNDLWVALNVNANGEMSPRQQLLAAVYALNANQLKGLVPGTAANNLVQLDAFGKIPAGLVSGGSVSVPLSLNGNSANYILQTDNSGTGLAVSATSASTSLPAVWGEGARYGIVAKTNDSVNGVALQAQGPGAAYASLIDRVKNAQVYGLAAAANVVGVLGENSNASGVAVAGNGAYLGVSGNGATYGVYGSSGLYGVYGSSSVNYGVYGNSPSGVGTYGRGVWGVQGFSNTNMGNDRGVYGQYTGGSAGTGVLGENSSTAANAKAVWGNQQASTGQVYGVYGQIASNSNLSAAVYAAANASTGQTYGVRAVNASSSPNSAGVYGSATSATANATYGVQGDTASTYWNSAGVHGIGSANGRGVFGETAGGGVGVQGYSSNGTGVYGANLNYNSTGVGGEGQTGVSGSSFGNGGAGVYAYSEADSPPVWAVGYNSGNVPGVQVDGNYVGVSSSAYALGVYGVAGSPTGAGVVGYNTDTTGASKGVYGESKSSNGMGGHFVNYAGGDGLVAEGSAIAVSAAGATYGVYAQGGSYGAYTKGSNYGTYADGTYAVWANGSAYGVVSFANNSGGTAVYANSGSGGYGVQAYGNGTGAYALYGSANGTGSYGVYATSSGGPAVYGNSSTTSYGVQGVAGSSSGGRGVYGQGNCATCYGGYFENTAATSSTSGYALFVNGLADLPSAAGIITAFSGSTSKVVTNTYMHASDIVLLTAANAPSPATVRWWVTSAAGSFTINFSTALTGNLTFNYLIVGR